MIALRDEGKIGAIGVSAVPEGVVRRALPAGIVCVQNAYSLLDRSQERRSSSVRPKALPGCRTSRSALPYRCSPSVTDNPEVVSVAGEIGATPAQVGLAWLLAHSPNTLLIPGTRSPAHLDENIAVGAMTLPPEAIARLDAVPSVPLPSGVEAFLDAED